MPTGHLVRSNYLLIVNTTSKAATFSTTFTLPLGDSYTLILDTGAATGTSPTLDATLQMSTDGGTTWVVCPVRSTQKAATAAVEIFTFRPNLGDNEAGYAQVVAATGGQLCKNFVPISKDFRLTCTIAGTNPNYATIKAYLATNPRG